MLAKPPMTSRPARAREMHRAGADGMLAHRAGAVVDDLELVHFVEVRAQHPAGRAFGQEGHRCVDALVVRARDEIAAPGEMPVRQVALDAGILDFVVRLDQWHCEFSCVGWVILYCASSSRACCNDP